MDALQILGLSKVPAVVTDEEDRLLGLNEAAEKLLGFAGRQVAGRKFSQVFRPLDVFNNPLRYDGPLFVRWLEEGNPVRNFECNLLNSAGVYQRTAISVVVVTNALRTTSQIVHLLWPVMRRRRADEVIARLLDGAGYSEQIGFGGDLRAGDPHASVLTARQVEILRAVAAGDSTSEIAERLALSPATVRNHIRNILDRLGVHSRVEAVSIAHRRHLI